MISKRMLVPPSSARLISFVCLSFDNDCSLFAEIDILSKQAERKNNNNNNKKEIKKAVTLSGKDCACGEIEPE